METLIITFIIIFIIGVGWGMGLQTMLDRYCRYKHLNAVIKGRRK